MYRCTAECPTSYYATNIPEPDVTKIIDAALGICRQCAKGCSKCSSAMQCIECESKKWLIHVSYPIAPAAEYHDGQCVEKCPDNLAEDSLFIPKLFK
jgi:hypothetical protein